MKTIFRSYSRLRRKVQSEEVTIDNLDTINDTEYLRLFKKREITGEVVAFRNHEVGLMYYVTIVNEDNTPYCTLSMDHENEFVGVYFLDNSGREYLTYHFCEVEPMKILFLEEIWYTFYPNSEAKDGNYRLHFVFDQDGNAAYRKYDDINGKITDFESNQPLNTANLYEDYPEFGHYDEIIRLERNIDFLSNMFG